MLSKSELYNSDTHHKSRVKASFHKAFTLAETLIALVIIGVIAAITIPQIVNKYNRTIMETRLKHTYSVLSNMFKRAEVDYGSFENWDLSEFGEQISLDGISDKQNAFISKYILPYVIYMSYDEKTFSEFGYKKGILYPDKSVAFTPTNSAYGLILQNGICIFLMARVQAWSLENMVLEELYLFTDINGAKGPNIVGKDIFVFRQVFIEGHPLATYGEYSSSYCTYSGSDIENYAKANKCAYVVNTDNGALTFFPEYKQSNETVMANCKRGNNAAMVCGTVIKNNGWKIPDDYPWL